VVFLNRRLPHHHMVLHGAADRMAHRRAMYLIRVVDRNSRGGMRDNRRIHRRGGCQGNRQRAKRCFRYKLHLVSAGKCFLPETRRNAGCSDACVHASGAKVTTKKGPPVQPAALM
jgi:hypothetical protein